MVAVLLVAIAGITSAMSMISSVQKPGTQSAAVPGHPTLDMLVQMGVVQPGEALDVAGTQSRSVSNAATLLGDPMPTPTGGTTNGEFELDASILAPLASGEFVNFESPPVNPIAYSGDSGRVYVANTPNNSLTVIDTAGSMSIQKEIYVGLEPVSVAVQPGTGGNVVWVANFVSDTVAIVDIAAGVVSNVIEVGDEPVNILFDPSGAFAFVVIQGTPLIPDNAPPPPINDPFIQLGHLVTIDVPALQILHTTFLDCNKPRAAVYDPENNQIIVAAVHAGNNTSVAGEPIPLAFANPPPTNPPPIVGQPASGGNCLSSNNPCSATSNGCDCVTIPDLWVAQNFTPTATIFANSPELSPWPDDLGTNAAPLVPRIVRDTTGDWNTIVQTLVDSNGTAIPAMVQQLADEFGILNAQQVIDELAADVKDTLDHDLIVLDASNPAGAGSGLPVVNIVSDVGTTLTGMGRNPTTGALFVSNLEALNTTRMVKNLNGHFIDHMIEIVTNVSAGASVIDVNLHSGINQIGAAIGGQATLQARKKSLANPLNVVFSGDGSFAYLAALGPDRVGVLDGSTGQVLGRVDVPAGPRGLALDDVGGQLYVWSRQAATVSRVDVSNAANPTVQDSVAVFNPEPARIRNGRKFLYSTKFSADAQSSCALCHIDAGLDGLAWDLGSNGPAGQPGPPNLPFVNHPLKGPMVTMSLRGLDRHEPLHWRGDKTVFQNFNEAFEHLLGGSRLPDADMDAYADYAKTIVYPPNPLYKRTNAFKNPQALNGAITFVTGCNPCHQFISPIGSNGVPTNPGGFGHDGAMFGTNGDEGFALGNLFAQLQLVTQMRNIHRKFPNDLYTGFGLIHDGREEREDNLHPLDTFLKTFFPTMGDQTRLDMIAFNLAFASNVMNVVGWQIQITPPIASETQDLSDINVMIAQFQKTPSHCDVVAKGIVAGQSTGFYLLNVNSNGEPIFQADDGSTITLSALTASLAGQDSLLFTAVPPGSGKRIGVDQDTDGLLDGLDPFPQLDNTGDFDLDADVDLRDAATLQRCFTGAGGGVGIDCLLGDADEDGDVDLADYTAIEALYSGPQ